jgi:sarcinarray family protein
MKMAIMAILLLALVLSASCDASARNVIKAYFNGQEATVTGAKLKIGEPFTVDLYVTPDRQTTVAALLREPGGGEDAYALISGDPRGIVTRKNGGPNDTVHFQWILAPTEAWAGGTAPLNLQYDVWGETMDGDVQGYFTVVEAYISPERYKPPRQSGIDPVSAAFSMIAALALAARHRLPRITKPVYPE